MASPDEIIDRMCEMPEFRAAIRIALLWAVDGDAQGWARASARLAALVQEALPFYASSPQERHRFTIAAARTVADELISQLGRRYRWSFEHEASLLADFSQAIGATASGLVARLDWVTWQTGFNLAEVPFRACQARCAAVCRYRFFVSERLDPAARHRFAQALAGPEETRWTTAAQQVVDVAAAVKGGEFSELHGVALCASVQLAQTYSVLDQDRELLVARILQVVDDEPAVRVN